MLPLVELKDLFKEYPQGKGVSVKALQNIHLSIYPGETLGLVGESGSGKSTLGRISIYLETPTQGDVLFHQTSLTLLQQKKQIKAFRKEAQMIFQDPYASLNPRMTLFEIISEPFSIHSSLKDKQQEVDFLLSLVGLSPSFASSFPHALSGGQRQRVGIARALALRPKFIVCDEPVSALDVSVQAQIINLLKKLQQELNLTYLFIAHDLRLVKYISSRIAVLYLGCLMELAPAEDLCAHPLHPYTKALLNAIPLSDPEKEKARPKILLQGEIPSPLNPPKGCTFSFRCPHAKPLCRQVRPLCQEVAPGRFVACHFPLQ